jgi:hypothetical protein
VIEGVNSQRVRYRTADRSGTGDLTVPIVGSSLVGETLSPAKR